MNYLNEFENDLIYLNEFENEERFKVFFKGLKKVFNFIVDIIIKLIAYVTKKLYVFLSAQIDKFNMMSKYIKQQYLKDPTKTTIEFIGKNITDIDDYRNSLYNLYGTYETSFNKINLFQTIEQIKSFEEADKLEIERQKKIINSNKERYDKSSTKISLNEFSFSNNIYTLKETRKELSEIRISLVLDKRLMKKQISDIDRLDFSDVNEFLKSKKNLLSLISNELIELSKKRIEVVKRFCKKYCSY